ncbi:MAG: hypothetical protein GY952_12880 [Rhodobacteraceae bacterium]|nr:hypothetical protein [Paracoccaceae bacterium]
MNTKRGHTKGLNRRFASKLLQFKRKAAWSAFYRVPNSRTQLTQNLIKGLRLMFKAFREKPETSGFRETQQHQCLVGTFFAKPDSGLTKTAVVAI